MNKMPTYKKIVIVLVSLFSLACVIGIGFGGWIALRTFQMDKNLDKYKYYQNEEIGWFLDFEQSKGIVVVEDSQYEVIIHTLGFRLMLDNKDPNTNDFTRIGTYFCRFTKNRLILTNTKNNEKITLHRV